MDWWMISVDLIGLFERIINHLCGLDVKVLINAVAKTDPAAR